MHPTPTITLHDTTEADLPFLFEQQMDADANRMAAFTSIDPTDREAFMARWAKILANPAITKKTIFLDGAVVGNVNSFEMFEKQMVSYWIDKAQWGKGIASEALRQLLETVTQRPLYALAAKDNFGSVRVLQKCGFVITGEDKGFSNARGVEVEEWMLILNE